MAGSSSASSLLHVPLFPLPNVVLFPRAVLPLHIFEQRYRQMTADVLAGPKQIAMALLRSGWEKSYYQKPEIEPIVCVGTILSHELLPDGKYNFLLQGQTRARIVREVAGVKPYRVAELEPLVEIVSIGDDFAAQRSQLKSLLNDDGVAASIHTTQLRQLVESTLPVPDIADLIAFGCIEDVALKQSLLAEADVFKRVNRTINELSSLIERSAMIHETARRASLN